MQIISQRPRGGKSDTTALCQVPECAKSSNLCDRQSERLGNNENWPSSRNRITDFNYQHGRVQKSVRQEGRKPLSDFSATVIYQDIIKNFDLPTNIPPLFLFFPTKKKRKNRCNGRLKIIKSDLNTIQVCL